MNDYAKDQPDGGIADALARVRDEIARHEVTYGRTPGSVQLLAVSKTKPVALIREAMAAGQRAFGENYLEEAEAKIAELRGQGCEWHFIGHIQSRKSAAIAADFDWAHGIEREKVARRLSAQRPAGLPPLNICLQVNIDGEDSKSGVAPGELPALAALCATLPNLRLRGLMCIPAPRDSLDEQRAVFRQMRELLDALRHEHPGMDTLSMGMSADIEAAIAEGATIVRVGTAIFGERQR